MSRHVKGLFIEALESRIAPMCILPEHGNRPCNDTIVHGSPSPADAAYANANPQAPFAGPWYTTLAIGEETGGF